MFMAFIQMHYFWKHYKFGSMFRLLYYSACRSSCSDITHFEEVQMSSTFTWLFSLCINICYGTKMYLCWKSCHGWPYFISVCQLEMNLNQLYQIARIRWLCQLYNSPPLHQFLWLMQVEKMNFCVQIRRNV